MTIDQPVWVAVGLFVAYMAVVGLAWRATGTRYDALVDSREHVVRGIILSIGLGAVLLVIVTTWVGWWQAALGEGVRVGPAWVLVVPVLLGLIALVNIASIDFRSPQARLVPWILVGTLIVGFAEELVTRGTLVVGLRDGGVGEVWVWLITSALFALLHAMNALFGQSTQKTLVQVVMTFFAGTAFYVTLMTTGSLVVGMVLHALWDLGALGITATNGRQRPVAGAAMLVTFALALVAVWFVISAA